MSRRARDQVNWMLEFRAVEARCEQRLRSEIDRLFPEYTGWFQSGEIPRTTSIFYLPDGQNREKPTDATIEVLSDYIRDAEEQLDSLLDQPFTTVDGTRARTLKVWVFHDPLDIRDCMGDALVHGIVKMTYHFDDPSLLPHVDRHIFLG